MRHACVAIAREFMLPHLLIEGDNGIDLAVGHGTNQARKRYGLIQGNLPTLTTDECIEYRDVSGGWHDVCNAGENPPPIALRLLRRGPSVQGNPDIKALITETLAASLLDLKQSILDAIPAAIEQVLANSHVQQTQTQQPPQPRQPPRPLTPLEYLTPPPVQPLSLPPSSPPQFSSTIPSEGDVDMGDAMDTVAPPARTSSPVLPSEEEEVVKRARYGKRKAVDLLSDDDVEVPVKRINHGRSGSTSIGNILVPPTSDGPSVVAGCDYVDLESEEEILEVPHTSLLTQETFAARALKGLRLALNNPKAQPKSTQQLEAIAQCLKGEDFFLILPTGGGKSAVWNAIAKLEPERASIVVVPYKLLLEEQLATSLRLGIKATRFNSVKYPDPDFQLMFVQPEHFKTGTFSV